MKIAKIKVHQSVHFCGRENLGFMAGQMPGFPKGIEIDYDSALNAFKVSYDDKAVYVTKENVPYFEVAEVKPVAKVKKSKSVDELVDSVF